MKKEIEFIENYIKTSQFEQRKYGEVLTPIELVESMLDMLPIELWLDPNLRWLDPCNGIGNFSIIVIKRLMEGLKESILDETERFNHIIENMIYVCEIQEKNMITFKSLVNVKNTFNTDFLKTNFNIKFNVIIGNPPYQEMDGGFGGSAMPLYNKFIERALDMCDHLLFITPSRWFITGKGLDKFRKMMLNRTDIRFIKHFDGNGSDIFGKNVNIRGGISYFHIDKSYNGNMKFNGIELDNSLVRDMDCLFNSDIHYKIINKIKTKSNLFFNGKVESRNHFGNKVESCNYFGKKHNGIKYIRNSSDCVDTKIDDNYLKCYVRKTEGFIKYVHKDLINLTNVNKYKIFTTKGTNVGYMGNTFIGYPNEVCTETYLTILCDTEKEALDILNYFKTDFVKYLFKLLNITQSSSKDTYRLIPVLDNYNIDLFKYFELNDDEINLLKNYI